MILAWPPRARAAGPAYTAAVHPAHALIGERIVAALTGAATRGPAEALSFDDASLVLELRRLSSDRAARAFPNHQVVQTGDRTVRMSPERKRQVLQPGQRLSRTFVLFALFPELALDTGDFVFSYEIGDEPDVVRAAPAPLTIESGPAAVTKLLLLLADARSDVRTRAAGLLHRMTAYVAGYGPDDEAGARRQAIERWRRWWDGLGRNLPWSFATAGAAFGGSAGPAPRDQRSKLLGGVRYERRSLDPASSQVLSTALAAWLHDPASGATALEGRTWAGDRVFAYPPESCVIDPGDEAAHALESALSRLADLAASGAAEPPEARILLATAARMPNAGLVPPLSAIETNTRGNARWHRSLRIASGLLDVLDASRTPTGGG